MFQPRQISPDKILTPSQERTYGDLKNAALANPYVVFAGPPGRGRTLLLRRLATDIGAKFINASEIAFAIRSADHLQITEVIYNFMAGAMREHGSVVVDDFFSIVMLSAARGVHFRRETLAGLLLAVRDLPVREGRVLVIGGTQLRTWATPAEQYGEAVVLVEAEPFEAEDYAALLSAFWGDAAVGLDFDLIYRAAPALDAYQLRLLGNLLRERKRLAIEDVFTCLEQDVLESNIRLNEIEKLTFDSLPGSEAIATALEQHIILPFQNQALAEAMGVKPRRGVLLYGPPGTGKTSIGRALAHRMHGRFFLIDGTVVTEPPSHFFGRVEGVVRDAKRNAPSVLFIDDADVLFQIEHIAGLSRYLLSLLDGLESETSSNVCVVMTAMDAKKIPEALLRSGRIELWIETRAPDEPTRARIIDRWLAAEMTALGQVDLAKIARETEGFTPADLRRLAGDAKLLYANDLVAGRALESPTRYLETAIEEFVATRAIMAKRLADDALLLRPYA